jgi:transposase
LKEVGYFFCFEDTGHYSTNLAVFMSENAIDYIEENPLAIKRSSGIVRGKTDRLDAAMIARYAWIHKEELKNHVRQKQVQASTFLHKCLKFSL